MRCRWPTSRSAKATGRLKSPRTATRPNRAAGSWAYGACCSAATFPPSRTAPQIKAISCRRTLPIFDGSQRFDMVLSFKRMDNVKAETGYRGPAVVCAMTYRPVAGYTPGAFRVGYLQKNRDMEMWFAPIAGTRLLAVVRISIPTMLGTAGLRATQFTAAAV